MKRGLAIVDTNVVVSGLLASDPESPTARILDATLDGSLRFAVSTQLIAEYLAVLGRSHIRALHGLTDGEVELVLRRIAQNARFVEPDSGTEDAPDRGDQHLWDLMDALPDARLVTGDARLRRSKRSARIVSPADFVGE